MGSVKHITANEMLSFGKYKGKTLDYVFNEVKDYKYIIFLVDKTYYRPPKDLYEKSVNLLKL